MTGDGSQFDLPLQTNQPATPTPLMFEGAEHEPRGGRVFAIAGALVIGLLTGFAGGFLAGQRSGSVPAPQAAAAVVPQLADETFTEAAITEPPRKPVEPVVPDSPVARTLSGPRGEPDKARPTGAGVAEEPATLIVASRPDGAQVFLDGASIGRTPLVVPDVKTGTRRVRLELAGHRTWATVVNVEPGTRVRVGASLEK